MPVDVADAGAPSRVERADEAEMEAPAVEEGEYWGKGVTGPSWERRVAKTGSRASRSMAVVVRLASIPWTSLLFHPRSGNEPERLRTNRDSFHTPSFLVSLGPSLVCTVGPGLVPGSSNLGSGPFGRVVCCVGLGPRRALMLWNASDAA